MPDTLTDAVALADGRTIDIELDIATGPDGNPVPGERRYYLDGHQLSRAECGALVAEVGQVPPGAAAPSHPDALAGDKLAEVTALFGDIAWSDPVAVEQRVADLRALPGEG